MKYMLMKYHRQISLILLNICFCFVSMQIKAQVKASPENIMASFIYNFSGYIQWPPDSEANAYIITVLGDNSLMDPLMYISKTKKIDNKDIIIEKAANLEQIKKSHFLVVGDNFTSRIQEINSDTTRMPMIIITHCGECLQAGATFNFVTEKDRIRFEINKSELDLKNIKVSSQLLKLAVRVI